MLQKTYTKLKESIPDKIFIRIKFFKYFKSINSFKNPVSFNEKINFLKIYDDTDIKSEYADKIKVKNIMSDLIGEDYIIKTLSILDLARPFKDQLKNYDNFVLKTNFDSGNIFIFDKEHTYNYEEVEKLIRASLNLNFYKHGRELHYSRINKKVFIEKLLDDYKNLVDYKIFCFNGKAEYIQVDRNRFTNHVRSYYDTQWKKIENLTLKYPYDHDLLEKPSELEKMLDIAETTAKSQNFKFIRVDLYFHNKKIYFGENTFYPESGYGSFLPSNYDYIFGTKLQIWGP